MFYDMTDIKSNVILYVFFINLAPIPQTAQHDDSSVKAGPFDNVMPSVATPTQPSGFPSLPGGGGGEQSAQGNAKMIIGSFQAIVAPFDPSMMANIAGAMGQLAQNPPQMPNIG